MTDRELIELAAKSAGYTVLDGWSEIVVQKHENNLYPHAWNPISDDGDAFRLAVKLGLSINLRHCQVLIEDSRIDSIWQTHDGDELSATRRAIVRAAAEIGKTIQ